MWIVHKWVGWMWMGMWMWMKKSVVWFWCRILSVCVSVRERLYVKTYVCTFVRVLLNLYPAYLNALHTYTCTYVCMYVRTRDQCCCCCCSLEQNLSSISVFVFIFASLLIRHLFRFCVFAPLNRLALFPRFSFSYNRDFRNAIFWCTCCASSSSADAGSNRAQQQQQLIVAHTGILAYCIACLPVYVCVYQFHWCCASSSK